MFCFLCGGLLKYLGTLGQVLWFRCEDCGAESRETDEDCEPEGD